MTRLQDRRRDSRRDPARSLRRLLHQRCTRGGWELLAFGTARGELIAATAPPATAAGFLRDAAQAMGKERERRWATPAGFHVHAVALTLAGEDLLLVGVEEPIVDVDAWRVVLHSPPSLGEAVWRAGVIRLEERALAG